MGEKDFTVFPAIDIRGGRCVRLEMGRPDKETVFEDDPVEAALRWEIEGAGYVHVVDLDGAFAGEPINLAVIKEISARLDIPVQVGGGIRNSNVARDYLEAGVARVIVGTRAVQDPTWLKELAGELGEKLAVGLDSRGGRVAVSGWTASAGMTPLEAITELEDAGVKRVIFTDVGRDGTLEGPDFASTAELARAASIPIIASGGVSRIADIERLWRMRDLGVEGVIVGMALYRGGVTMEEIRRTLRGENQD